MNQTRSAFESHPESVSARLSEGAAVAKAALVCAENGSEREAVRIALNLNQVLHEAGSLHGAMALIG